MKRKFSWFVSIFLIVLISITYYIGKRLEMNRLHWAILLVLSFLLLLFPILHWRSRSEAQSHFKSILQQAGYIALAMMSTLLVWTWVRDLCLILGSLFFTSLQLGRFAFATSANSAYFVSTVFILVGVWNAFRGLDITEVEIEISDLPKEIAGFRIAQISDLHVSSTINKAYVERVVAMVLSKQPDLIVLTGDIVDGNYQDYKDVAMPLAQLVKNCPVFMVPGNHEYYWTIDQWFKAFQEMGISVLLNQGEAILYKEHPIWVGGVTDPAAMQTGKGDSPDAAKAALGGEAADLKILLSHRPGIAAEASRNGFQLQLSGHTHGGQFAPWTFVAKLFHEYFLGLLKHEKMWIYVSPGTGSWGPPIRIGTTPEVTLLSVIAPKAAQ